MKHTKEEAYEIIKGLVEKFENNKPLYMSKSGVQGEREIEEHLITPLFEALGWNDNANSTSLFDYDMRLQYPIDLKRGISRGGIGTKKVDFAFRIKGKNKFFVEAKVPSRELKPKVGQKPSQDTIESIWQAKTYGWSKNVSIVILTDFEEFRVFNTVAKPNKEKYWDLVISELDFKYSEYTSKFDLIWNTFSKDAVNNGSLDKYESGVLSIKKQSLDESLLEVIKGWRKTLSQNISYNLKKENKGQLTSEDLTEAVQTIIDRLIFIRFLEDNHIENDLYLKKYYDKNNEYFEESEDIYQSIIERIHLLAEDYNGNIFGKSNKDRHFSESLTISNSTFKSILKDLYDNSPYDFSIIPIEILGKIYEQYLGEVITIKTAGQIEITQKPDVRDAGGVFYTPEFIVNYIVEETVGKTIKGKSPTFISKIKILDPSCGSGSFLIGACKILFAEYESYFQKEYEEGNLKSLNKKYQVIETEEEIIKIGKPVKMKFNKFILTVEQKREIIINNLFGVDIDKQAVEVTKMSLFLKILEESSETEKESVLHGMKNIGKEKNRILPNLNNNIKTGNSLIENHLISDKCFIWNNVGLYNKELNVYSNRGFPDIFQNGGFDIIIGNPPWGASFNDIELKYLKELFKDIVVRMIDSYMYFVKHSINYLLKINGLWGMIVPDVILYQSDAKKLRKYIIDNSSIGSIHNMGNVFYKVNRPSTILTLRKVVSKNKYSYQATDLTKQDLFSKEQHLLDSKKFNKINISNIYDSDDLLFNVTDLSKSINVLDKIKTLSKNIIADIIDIDGIQRGASPDYKDAFIVDKTTIDKFNIEKKFLHPTVTGGIHIKRFHTLNPELFLIYTTRNTQKTEIPNIIKYIMQYKDKITCKEVALGKHPIYALHRPRKEHIYNKTKILGVITEDEIIVDIDSNNLYPTDGIYFFGVNEKVKLEYVIGVLNSNLYKFIYRLYAMEKDRVMAQVKPTLLEKIPFIIAEVKIQELISIMVIDLKSLNQSYYKSNLNNEKEQIFTKIAILSQRLNESIYEIYNLNKEEILMVESIVNS